MKILIILATLFASAFADQTIQWAIPPSTSFVRASPRESIIFSFKPPHNLYLMADEQHFTSCDFTDAVALGIDGPVTFTVPVDANNTSYYFGCSVTGHCQAGMKAEVTTNPAEMPPTSSASATSKTINFILGLVLAPFALFL
jgi:hypothetical protein